VKSCIILDIMTLLQLFNLLLVWLFFGMICMHFAKKKGKNPRLWFVIGTLAGIFGLLLVLLLPNKNRQKRKGPPLKRVEPPKRTDAHLKRWYYLDSEHKQVGPMEFTDLTETWKKKSLQKDSFIWSEGMEEWKRLDELPLVVQELDSTEPPQR